METKKNPFLDLYLPLLLVFITLIWKVLFINSRDICLDEPFTIFHAQDRIINILKLPTNNEPNPPLFMLILHFWIKLFGIEAHSVRVLPILFNAFTVLFLYKTGKRFFSFWTGLTASLLFIFSTHHFFFGGDTRTYSMLSFATAGSLYYLLSLQENPERKSFLAGLVISNMVLVYGHYFGWFIIFIQFVVSFFYLSNRKFLKKVFLALFLSVILYLPMITVMVKQFFISKESTWVSPPPGSEYFNQIKWFMNSETGLKVLAYILGAGTIAALLTRVKKEQIKKILLLLAWWIVPYSIMFFASSKVPMFINRYILFNSIGFYLFVGVSVSSLFSKIRFAGPVASIILIAVMFMRMFTGDLAQREVKKAADFIHTSMDSTTTIIIYPHWVDLEFMYHYDREGFKSIEKYTEVLSENNIFRTWGFDGSKIFINENNPKRIIYYQNNTKGIDPDNQLFGYLDSLYLRTDSVPFIDGIIVSIFDKPKKTNENNGYASDE